MERGIERKRGDRETVSKRETDRLKDRLKDTEKGLQTLRDRNRIVERKRKRDE